MKPSLLRQDILPFLYSCLALTLFLNVNSFSQCPTLIWGDDFDGTSLDVTNWSYQIGDGCPEGICGWGNNELQYYQASNVTISNGQLHITAKKERVKAKAYTSGRIRTINKGDWTYGRFEARIKLPPGKGLWPAFWMLPTDETNGGWPQSGEIDIMEFVGADPTHVLGTIHYGNPYPNNQFQGGKFDLYSGTFPDQFHNFAIEWENGVIRWFVDDILYLTKNAADLSPHQWPFDQRFHFLLNVAVGGNLGGPVDDSIFPSTMDVDYVRVYDGFKPYATGKRLVSNQEGNVAYQIGNLSNGTSVNWTVPAGATIVSGQGTTQVSVNFGSTSGQVTATFNTPCGQQQLTIPVTVEPAFNKEFSFENFDEPATAALGTFTGTHSEVSNPAPGGVNTSALVGRYVRNSSQQYDVLVYHVSNIPDASLYTSRTKKFYIDLYTNAPAGTEVLLQLETSTATSANYPTGRHSRYLAKVSAQNQWQRLPFDLLDRPDGGAPNTGVVRMILLFASNTFTGDTYHYDNLDSYASGSTNVPPTVSITSPANGASFSAGSVVTISAAAADSDGSVTQVEFFANGSPVGTDTSAPFSVNWTIGTGTFSLTARATDNSGAVTTSTAVSVTGEAAGSNYAYVASVVTGTVGVGSGRKSGTATVTIRDQSGNLVPNAAVTGDFTGTFVETQNAITGSDGVARLQTNASAKGSMTINFCVTDVVHNTFTYNPSANLATCAGPGVQSAAAPGAIQVLPETSQHLHVTTYPNPSGEVFQVDIMLPDESRVALSLIDATGRVLEQIPTITLQKGSHSFQFRQHTGAGLFFIRAKINDSNFLVRQITRQ